jgi:hypothetical protein
MSHNNFSNYISILFLQNININRENNIIMRDIWKEVSVRLKQRDVKTILVNLLVLDVGIESLTWQ